MSAIERLCQVARDPAGPARAHKAEGGKVMGYRCLYAPEEVITAAGLLPYPLYGTPEPVRLADAYFQSCTCEYIRNVFDQALEGELTFLDGLALSNTCDVIKRLCDIWGAYIEDTPVHMIANPQRLKNEGNRDFYLEELRRYRSWVSEVAGREITDEALRAAIKAHNETRSLLKELTSMRRADPPPLTGSEALELSMAAQLLPREEANALLREAIDEVKAREVEENLGPRLMVTGSIVDNAALIRLIEEEGGVVVADDLCNTIRTFWQPVVDDPEVPPLEALWRYGNERPWCACMHPAEERLHYLESLIDDLEVEAVIYFNLKYCHPFLYEAPLFKRALEAQEIAVNVLEVGHDLSGHGQLRTRIQAFIEMLEQE